MREILKALHEMGKLSPSEYLGADSIARNEERTRTKLEARIKELEEVIDEFREADKVINDVPRPTGSEYTWLRAIERMFRVRDEKE